MDRSEFLRLDEFTQAYIITALWSSIDTSIPNDGEKPLDDDHDESDLATSTVVKMIADCVRFQHEKRQQWTPPLRPARSSTVLILDRWGAQVTIFGSPVADMALDSGTATGPNHTGGY